MIEIDFSEGKLRVIELVDKWSEEIISDLMREIQKAADAGSIFDIESNMSTIREVNLRKEEVKKNIIFAKNSQQLISALECEVFDDVDDEILSKYLGFEIKIKKEK
jgi:hypothetical protein